MRFCGFLYSPSCLFCSWWIIFKIQFSPNTFNAHAKFIERFWGLIGDVFFDDLKFPSKIIKRTFLLVRQRAMSGAARNNLSICIFFSSMAFTFFNFMPSKPLACFRNNRLFRMSSVVRWFQNYFLLLPCIHIDSDEKVVVVGERNWLSIKSWFEYSIDFHAYKWRPHNTTSLTIQLA